MDETQGWKVGAMDESRIFAQLLGEMTSSPIFEFAPDCGRKVWANASKQNGVVQNLNFTIDQNWKYLFQTCTHENLLCSKHDQTPRLLQLSCTVL